MFIVYHVIYVIVLQFILLNVLSIEKGMFAYQKNIITETIATGTSRGLQCFKLNGNHTENDRYWQKNMFLLFAKCLKMYSFFRICILRLQKVLL
jgi:hypothetical protein